MRKLIVLVAVFALSACDRSKPQLEKTLAQVQQISAEKDSLIKDVMQTSQFIAAVNTELARVKSAKPVKKVAGELENPLSPAEEREQIAQKVKDLVTRLNETESRLAASRARVKLLTDQNSALKRQLSEFDSTIVAFRTIMANQRDEIERLNGEVSSLKAEISGLREEKVQLTSEKTQLTEEKESLTAERNAVYFVIGTKDELLQKKIIDQTGGALGIGKTQVPARTLSPADFTKVDRTKVSEIAFPKADKAYRIITRQDVTALAVPPGKDGRLRGGLKIVDAGKFWAATKYLILLEQ